MTKSSTLRVSCPRCGYDLTGVAEWVNQCPLEGRCSECGLAFGWSQVMRLSRSKWLFEHNWRHAPLRSLVGTLRRSFRPTRFWQELTLTDHIRIGPVLFLAGVIFVAPFAFQALWRAWTVHANQQIWGLPPVITGMYPIDLLLNSRYIVFNWIEHRIPGPLVVLLGMPLLFLLLPVTLQKAKIRRMHVLRIWLYSLIAPMLVFLIWCLLINLTWRPGWIEYTWVLNPWAWVSHFGAAERYFILIWSSLVGMAIAMACAWWVSRWWLRACEDYLELPEARTIVRVMVLILIMAAVIVQIFSNTQLQ